MVHGGDIYRNSVQIDFSVNGNPLGMPDSVRRALHDAVERCEEYPDIRAQRLYEALETFTGVDRGKLLCGGGASELFLAIVHAVQPKKTVIPVPSFGGYEYAAGAAGGSILFCPMGRENGFVLGEDFLKEIDEDTELIFLANPGNPAGNLTDKGLLCEIADKCMENMTTVVLDECFLEFTGREESCSMKEQLEEYPNLIIVRAFTKIFAVPGVRLGYMLCADAVLKEKTARRLPEWNLSTFAQAAGVKACEEKEYLRQTAAYVEKERQYLTERLTQESITVYPSETDFLLLYTRLPLYERLLEKGLLIRDCSSFRGMGKGFYRVAVKRHEENIQLVDAVHAAGRGGMK